MNCATCDAPLPLRALFCPSCGVQLTSPVDPAFDQPAGQGDEWNQPLAPAPSDHEALKARLIDGYVTFSMSRELSGWLQALGLPTTGTMREQLTRLRQQADSLVLPAESLPRQTIWYLNGYDEKILTEICEALGIDNTGPTERQISRIYHAVGLREGWLQPLSEEARTIITGTFLPILRAVDHRNYADLDQWGELGDLLDRESRNRPDHQGHGSAFMAVLIPSLLQEAHRDLLQHELDARAGKPF